MATFDSKVIPFSYQENGSTQNIKLVSVFDTDLKRTFIYRTEGLLATRTLIAFQDPNQNITPFFQNGQFVASDTLRNELVNNQTLKESIQSGVKDGAKKFLSTSGQRVSPSTISQQQVDNLLGTNSSATEGAQTQPLPNGGAAGATQPGQSSDPEIPITIIEGIPGVNTPEKFESTTSGGLRYPEKASDDEDYIKFETYEYKPKTLNGPLNSPVGDNLGGKLGEVILPIQSQISDSNTVGWGDGRVNAVDLEVFKLARSGITGGIDKFTDDASSVLNNLVKNKTYGQAFALYAAGQAANVNNIFSRVSGGILNPNLELLFEGPELRSFNFQFQLSPRSSNEATKVREIIRFFKKSMSVQRSNTDIFLKSPNVFKISYIKGGGEHKSLNRFKTCALRSFDVDYTPLGTYMTFDDSAGTMVSYGLSMQFQEIDPVFSDDYDKLGQDEIGF